MTKYALALLALATMAHCQIKPELVSSQSYAAYMNQELPLPNAPSSFTRTEKAAIALNAGLRIADTAITCEHLSNGLREQWLPTQSCVGVASFVLAGIPAQIVGMRLAKHYGHPWLATTIEWGLPIGSAVAVGYSTIAHQRRTP